MKKTLAFILALTMLAAILTGCSQTDTPSTSPAAPAESNSSELSYASEPVELTVWAWDVNFNGAALAIADKLYEGATINMVEMAKADVLAKVHTVLAGGSTEDLPDIVLIGDLSAPAYFMSYDQPFKEMTDIINYDDFADYKKQSVCYEGKYYGVPFDTGVAGMYYRTDYFEEAGYTMEQIQAGITWDEYIEAGKKIRENGHYLTTLNPGDLSLFQIMLQSCGSWYTDENGEPNLVGNDALKECFEIFGELQNSGVAKKISDWSEYAAALNGGEVAATVSGGWLSATIMAEEADSGKWAIAPVPKMSTAGGTNYSNQGGSSWYVMSSSENAEVAADFLAKTFAGSTELYDELLETKSIMGTYLPASDVPAYEITSDYFSGLPVNKNFAEWLSKVPEVNYGAYSFETQSILVPVLADYLGGADIDTCLQTAQDQLTALIEG